MLFSLGIASCGVPGGTEIQTSQALMLQNDIPMKVQEAYRTPNRLNQNKTKASHIIIKTQNIQNKERILRAAKEKRSSNL